MCGDHDVHFWQRCALDTHAIADLGAEIRCIGIPGQHSDVSKESLRAGMQRMKSGSFLRPNCISYRTMLEIATWEGSTSTNRNLVEAGFPLMM